MTDTIYIDPASIHAEMLKRHPEIRRGDVWLNTATTPHLASCLDTTGVPDGPADIDWDTRYFEDYHGFKIEMLRLVARP